MRPLKLCFVGWGDHIHLERWAGHFALRGHEVSVLSVSGKGKYPPAVRQYALKLSGRRAALADLELRGLLAWLRPDIVHAHWAHFATAVARVWPGPLAVTAWGSDIYRKSSFSEVQWQALSAALARADLVTCDSVDLARTIRDTFDVCADSLKIVQWGVDTELFAPAGSSWRDRLHLGERPIVFSARNFTPLYNQTAVVDAFAIVRVHVPSAFLLMKNYGGEPSYVAAVRRRIAEAGLEAECHIVDTVPYEQMPELYRAASVTISVPDSDATPLSILEAMSCGSFPVASDLPSLREWIVNGENGVLVKPGDVTQLAEGVTRAVGDDTWRLRVRTSNRQSVIERASQRMHMDRCEAYYRNLVLHLRGNNRRPVA